MTVDSNAENYSSSYHFTIPEAKILKMALDNKVEIREEYNPDATRWKVFNAIIEIINEDGVCPDVQRLYEKLDGTVDPTGVRTKILPTLRACPYTLKSKARNKPERKEKLVELCGETKIHTYVPVTFCIFYNGKEVLFKHQNLSKEKLNTYLIEKEKFEIPFNNWDLFSKNENNPFYYDHSKIYRDLIFKEAIKFGRLTFKSFIKKIEKLERQNEKEQLEKTISQMSFITQSTALIVKIQEANQNIGRANRLQRASIYNSISEMYRQLSLLINVDLSKMAKEDAKFYSAISKLEYGGKVKLEKALCILQSLENSERLGLLAKYYSHSVSALLFLKQGKNDEAFIEMRKRVEMSCLLKSTELLLVSLMDIVRHRHNITQPANANYFIAHELQKILVTYPGPWSNQLAVERLGYEGWWRIDLAIDKMVQGMNNDAIKSLEDAISCFNEAKNKSPPEKASLLVQIISHLEEAVSNLKTKKDGNI